MAKKKSFLDSVENSFTKQNENEDQAQSTDRILEVQSPYLNRPDTANQFTNFKKKKSILNDQILDKDILPPLNQSIKAVSLNKNQKISSSIYPEVKNQDQNRIESIQQQISDILPSQTRDISSLPLKKISQIQRTRTLKNRLSDKNLDLEELKIGGLSDDQVADQFENEVDQELEDEEDERSDNPAGNLQQYLI